MKEIELKASKKRSPRARQRAIASHCVQIVKGSIHLYPFGVVVLLLLFWLYRPCRRCHCLGLRQTLFVGICPSAFVVLIHKKMLRLKASH